MWGSYADALLPCSAQQGLRCPVVVTELPKETIGIDAQETQDEDIVMVKAELTTLSSFLLKCR